MYGSTGTKSQGWFVNHQVKDLKIFPFLMTTNPNSVDYKILYKYLPLVTNTYGNFPRCTYFLLNNHKEISHVPLLIGTWSPKNYRHIHISHLPSFGIIKEENNKKLKDRTQVNSWLLRLH